MYESSSFHAVIARTHDKGVDVVCFVRVYLDGDYHEPSPDLLPSVPMVEEVKDCSCVIT